MATHSYVSDELTHFVGRSKPNDGERYQLLLDIVRQGWLTSTPGAPGFHRIIPQNFDARMSDNAMYNPHMICFCDIPIGALRIHMQKYGPFGLAFSKVFLAARGANPVFYIAKRGMVLDQRSLHQTRGGRPEAPQTEVLQWYHTIPSIDFFERGTYFDELMGDFHPMMEDLDQRIQAEMTAPGASGDPSSLRRLYEFENSIAFNVLSYMKFFDHTKADDDPENYYMEREWRTVHDVPFEMQDIQRIIVPRVYIERLGSDLPEYAGEVTCSEDC